MPPIFDPDQYTTVPTRSPGATLSLARGLISASSARPPASLAKRLVRLRDRAKLLQMSWVDASRPAVATESLRQLDTVLDRRWNAMRGRLDACVQLGDDDHAPRAEKMLVVLFPSGLDFLKLAYPEEWAESERRLVLIETDELEGELAELAGKPYLPLLQQAHAAYGKALGITVKKDEAPESARVLEPLRDLKDAIASYARGVVGTVDEDDAKSLKAAQTQLEPILRARRARPAGETEVEAAEPIEAPLPELPTAVAEVDEAAE